MKLKQRLVASTTLAFGLALAAAAHAEAPATVGAASASGSTAPPCCASNCAR